MTLRAPTTRVGAAVFDGSTDLFSAAANNRFNDNTYRVLDRRGAYWAWNGQTLTWASGRRSGMTATAPWSGSPRAGYAADL